MGNIIYTDDGIRIKETPNTITLTLSKRMLTDWDGTIVNITGLQQFVVDMYMLYVAMLLFFTLASIVMFLVLVQFVLSPLVSIFI